MSDAITFNCTGCGKAYRVAANYAGREFGCKECGTRLSVPVASQREPGPDDSRVELGSGGEVMRRTTSGRQVVANPTRVFAKQRETSARMVAVGPAQEDAPKSGKRLIIGVVLVLVLAGGGLAAAFAMGVFQSEANTGSQTAEGNNAGTSPQIQQEDVREKILKQVDVPGQTAADFVNLLKQADEAKLDDLDVVMVARKLVTAISGESGAGFSDADLMLLAARMEKLNARSDADTLYSVIVARNRQKADKPPEFKQAHERLGHVKIDLDATILKAAELRDSGVVTGLDQLHDELLEIEERADDGWVPRIDKTRFDEIVGLVNEAQEKYDLIAKTDPFQLELARARNRFKLEKISKIGSWVSFGREPYVVFCQQQAGEDDEAKTLERINTALTAATQFPEFFKQTVAEPLGLRRMLPSDLEGDARDKAPFEILLFRDGSYMNAYLREKDIKHVDASKISSLTEPATGRISMVYEDERTSLGKFIRGLVDSAFYNYNPRAPKTQAEDDEYRGFSSYWLNAYFAAAVSFVTASPTRDEFTYFVNDTRVSELMGRLAGPYKVADNGKIDSFGGPAFTARQILGLTKWEDAQPLMRANLEGYEGWTKNNLDIVTNDTNTRSLLGSYMHALLLFTYFGSPDAEARYREKLIRFIRMDLDGEVDSENPLPAFEKAFGLDEAGWKKFEAEFLAWQKGE
ncbi:MAG: hypothetical protein KDB90_07195 [Planctomycetes bacterium]|nr:hypothetical protein [Planctomycetota bacterium]